MKRIFFIILIWIQAWEAWSQTSYPDSLLQFIRSSDDMQTRLQTTRAYAVHYAYLSQVDSMHAAADRLIKLGQERELTDVLSFGKTFKAWAYNNRGQVYKALGSNIEALKLAEKLNNNFLLAAVHIRFGNIYFLVNQDKSLKHSRKAIEYLEKDTSRQAKLAWGATMTNIGSVYNLRKQYDSALYYFKKDEETKIFLKDTSSKGTLYNNLGNVYLNLNQPKLAHAYYLMSMESAKKFKESGNIGTTWIKLANYYKKLGMYDSALASLDSVFSKADIAKLPAKWLLEPMKLYYEIYRDLGRDKEAVKYNEHYSTTKLKNDSIGEIQLAEALYFEEDQRQLALEEGKVKEIEQRKRDLQYAAIALGVVVFIILFFLLSHSIFANQRLISFLGILALLIVFEFLNLLLHPYIGELTHHSPVLMLASMVAIAALLIPLHHKLQHWITHILVEKNKKIRLASARKTIEKLERN